MRGCKIAKRQTFTVDFRYNILVIIRQDLIAIGILNESFFSEISFELLIHISLATKTNFLSSLDMFLIKKDIEDEFYDKFYI